MSDAQVVRRVFAGLDLTRGVSIVRAALAIAVTFVALAAPPSLQAEPLTLAIDPDTLSAVPGETVIFTGRITNLTGMALNASDIFLNFNAFDPGALSVTQILGSSDFVLLNRTISPVVDLFSVTLALNAAGTYSLEAFLQDINSNFSNTVAASVVADSVTPIPEPATLVLCLAGLTGVRLLRGKRRSGAER